MIRVVKQTIWQLLGKVVTSLATFIILGLIARNYGETGTGIFTLTLIYLAIFYLLSDFGFNAHVLKNLQFTIDNLQFRKLLGLRIIWSLVLVGLAVGTLPFWPFANVLFSQSVLFGSLAILASGVFITCNLIFQSRLRYDLSVLASSIGSAFGVSVFIYLISLRLPISYLLFAHLITWLTISIVAIFMVRRIIKTTSPIYDIRYIISIFHSSWPIALTLVLNVVYFRADSFLIAYFKGISDVGVYNVAYSVFQSALVLPTFIMNAYYPLMLKSFAGIRKVGLGLLCLALLGTGLTFLIAPVIIRIITGGGFLGSSASLQILSLGFPAYFVSSLLMWVLVSKNKYKLMLIIYFVGLIFNLILNLYFIPKYSYVAASWSTVLSEYLILIMQAASLF